MQNIEILHVNDVMAYSRLSADNLVSHIFGHEDSFDDSDSESGEDIYGYLGAFALSRHELEEESRILTGGVDEEEDQISSEDALANNEEPLGEDLCGSNIEQASHSAIEDDVGNECDATAIELTNPSINSVNEGDTTNSVPPALVLRGQTLFHAGCYRLQYKCPRSEGLAQFTGSKFFDT